MAQKVMIMARNSFFTVALVSALALSAAAPAAFAAEQATAGSVEGYGGLSGRVGSQVSSPVVSQTQQPGTVGLASVEGYGGYAGRVGAPAISDVGVAQNTQNTQNTK
jgi:hypothetical protein